MEIGSFIDLDLRRTGEFYNSGIDIARLNSGRAGILHSLKLLNCSTVYLPYYLCPDVKKFLSARAIKIRPYNISNEFLPVIEKNGSDTAILIVNYFGLLSEERIELLTNKYSNVIIDNCSAFFARSIKNCYNIYSCRKFFGVPDGSYVVGPGAALNVLNYPQDVSSETSSFLLKRIEKGSSAVYVERMRNEKRIDNSDILRMSLLTQSLLGSLDYKDIKKIRIDNYRYACELYRPFNLLNINDINDDDIVPLFYPLLIMDCDLVSKFQKYKIYTGRRWANVLQEVDHESFEAFLSNYMVPIPIDQRYGKKELDYCFQVFKKISGIDK